MISSSTDEKTVSDGAAGGQRPRHISRSTGSPRLDARHLARQSDFRRDLRLGIVPLASFSRPLARLAVAVPYLVIVVAMGYTRQSIALGVLMAGLARQSRGASTLNFSDYTTIAAAFHQHCGRVSQWSRCRDRATGGQFLSSVSRPHSSLRLFPGQFDGHARQELHSRPTILPGGGHPPGDEFRRRGHLLWWPITGWSSIRKRNGSCGATSRLASIVLLILLFICPSSTAVDRMSHLSDSVCRSPYFRGCRAVAAASHRTVLVILYSQPFSSCG